MSARDAIRDREEAKRPKLPPAKKQKPAPEPEPEPDKFLTEPEG